MPKRNNFEQNKVSTNKKDSVESKKTYSDKGKGCKQKSSTYGVPIRSNPVEWYYPNEQLGKDAASLSYHILTGTGHAIYSDLGLGLPRQRVNPGIMTIKLVDGVGQSGYSTSTINTAVRSIYSWVRHQNSGHSNYEAPDLGIYILAMAEVYARFAEICRVYRVAMTYKWVNRYIPDTILEAMNVDAADVRGNLAQFRAGLNIIAAKISSLAVPNVFPIFRRRDMLYSNIYMDSDTDRGQYYIFRKANYRTFDATSSPNGGKLVSHDIIDTSSTKQTVERMLQQLNDMLEPILADEDMNIMSGDILKAYGRESLYVVNSVDENATCQPVFDETILSQIENMNCLPFYMYVETGADKTRKYATRSVVKDSLDIYQEAGYLKYVPRYQYACSGEEAGASSTYVLSNLPVQHVLNSHVNDPDWKFSLEASRLMATYDMSAQSIHVRGGSEFVSDVKITTHSWDVSNQRYTPVTSDVVLNYRADAVLNNYDDTAVLPMSVTLMSAFDWHPFVYGIKADANGTKAIYGACPMGDFKVFTYVSRADIDNMNECAILALFRTNLLT